MQREEFKEKAGVENIFLSFFIEKFALSNFVLNNHVQQ